MTARADFISTVGHFRLAVSDPLLIALQPTEIEHNGRARLLRNGLAVVGFAALEHFMKARFREAVGIVNGNAVRFVDLPDKLRQSATREVVRGLSTQIGFAALTDQDREDLIIETATHLASSANAAFSLSPLIFGSQRANITADQVTDLLGVLGVEGGWTAIQAVATRAGVGVPSLVDSFRRFSELRNAAAHDATSDVAQPDLERWPLQAFGIALAFDALVSRACRLLAQGDPGLLGGQKVVAATIGLVYLRLSDAGCREIKEGSRKALRVHPDPMAAMTSTLGRIRQHEFIVHQDLNGIPTNWSSTDAP